MPIVNVSLQVLPSVAQENIYPVVDKVIELIRDSGVKYIVGPMETTMEGEFDTLMEIVKKAQTVCCEAGARRVISVVKIDYRPEGVTIEEKIGKYQKEA
ncbi:MAG: thiamine-binding protein [Clostridiaceae bacterium]|nr:thiamine-binding protein [Bacillota bacterium]NLI38520.1 thiamine-binding protein [Clostridiaceae bacterium]